MTCYIVTFEISSSERRENAKGKLQEFGSYCPIHENCWAIISDKSAQEVREFVDEVLVDADRIFVIRTGTYAAWRNTYGEKNSEWLKENL